MKTFTYFPFSEVLSAMLTIGLRNSGSPIYNGTNRARRRKRLHRLRAAFGGRIPKVRRIGVRGPGR